MDTKSNCCEQGRRLLPLASLLTRNPRIVSCRLGRVLLLVDRFDNQVLIVLLRPFQLVQRLSVFQNFEALIYCQHQAETEHDRRPDSTGDFFRDDLLLLDPVQLIEPRVRVDQNAAGLGQDNNEGRTDNCAAAKERDFVHHMGRRLDARGGEATDESADR